jgi:type II secretory pathway component GspD/PulD (secretin)
VTGELGTAFQLDQEGIGFTYRAFNQNLTALLHTLMRENRVRVLSTPSLLTRDNETAELSKGKDIPYLESTRTDQWGNIMYDYNFLQDIGINIRITPHIAKGGSFKRPKEGKLLFGIELEHQTDLDNGNISEDLRQEFGNSGILLSRDATVLIEEESSRWLVTDSGREYHIREEESKLNIYESERRTVGLDIENMNVSSFIEYTDFNAPVTADSTVTTYVDVEDGEQIVIGGMMKSETKRVTHKIPILGSIPFLGRLFKKTEDITEDTELLILITPHIIDINREEDRAVLKELRDQLNSREKELMQPGAEVGKRQLNQP